MRSQWNAQPPALSDAEHDKRFDAASETTLAIFTGLMGLYGKLWEREHSASPSPAFDGFARDLDSDRANRILRRAREKFERGEKFPPSLGELIAWSDMPTEGELFDIRQRVFSRQPANDLELWIVRHGLYNLRRMPEREVMASIRSLYAQAVRKERAGELFAAERDILALPATSEVNQADRARNDYDADTSPEAIDSKVEVRAMLRRIRGRVAENLKGSETLPDELPEL